MDTLAGRLTRTLILWVGGIWLAGVLAVAWYIGGEIDYNFDSELAEISHRMFDIALDRIDGAPPQANGAHSPLIVPAPAAFAASAVPFQVVDAQTRVLARSAGTPEHIFDVPLVAGFANADGWRIYTLQHPSRGVFLQVGDPLGEGRKAVNRKLVGVVLGVTSVSTTSLPVPPT